MIVRSCFRCATCGRAHTVRIGMGHETTQTHRFPCVSCGEDMVVALHVDFQAIRHWTEAVENAEEIPEEAAAAIVNVDAGFVVPEDERHLDYHFPRMAQMHRMFEEARKHGSTIRVSDVPKASRNARPFRRPDFADEWKQLKKAWSLHRNGHEKLSNRKMEEASTEYYGNEPLGSIQDWLWRFVTFLMQPLMEPKFRGALAQIEPVFRSDGFRQLMHYYDKNMSVERGTRYLELMREFFSSFSEFSQVYFLVLRGVPVPAGNIASSIDFNRTRMFYGNAFEVFTSSVDILALINNLICGREFDKFEQLTLEKYLKLDKASRFNCFAMNVPFTDLCRESDNQLRNASHHGSFTFDPVSQLIQYRSGPGGGGPEMTLAYGAYLVRCVNLFLQVMVLLRLELLVCHNLGSRPPL